MTRTDISFATRLKRKQYFTAASMVINDSEVLGEAMEIFFHGEWRENQKIANTLQYVKKRKQEQIIEPYYTQWVEQLKHPPHAAFERNSFRYFQNVYIPEDLRGYLYEMAFAAIINPQKAIPIRAFSMSVCANIAESHPELIPELKEAIHIAADTDSAGIKARAKNVLNRLQKSERVN